MKGKLFYILFVLLAAMPVSADDSIEVTAAPVAERANLLDEMAGVEIIQDSSVYFLLEATMNGRQEIEEKEGYRVQIYSSNQQQRAKAEALELEAKLKNRVEPSIYVQYAPPFWKVRIGDFRTYNEAKEDKKIFVQRFPQLMGNTYIVRDKINVLK